MSYVDGYVIACPKANRDAFIEHARMGDSVFIELGALRVVECWGDDVQIGTVTDFRMAVKANDDEEVLFSWVEWPDKATRDAAMGKLRDMAAGVAPADPRMDPVKNPMPYDGRRMIFGGFVPIVEVRR
jgi:uncharacterized protein YbaA (DUF1428 family)